LHLEASLAWDEILVRNKKTAMGYKQLDETERTARLKGFELIARKARASRAATEPAKLVCKQQYPSLTRRWDSITCYPNRYFPSGLARVPLSINVPSGA
jgi:hypothetical protein